MKTILFLFAISASIFQLNAQDIKIIHAGSLLATPGEAPLKNSSILIENGIIKEVRKGFVSATDFGVTTTAEIVDLKNKFVLPGLIDLHTHITGERDPKANPYQWVTQNEADQAFNALPYAKKTLEAGFTTVRNLGANPSVILALKRATETGVVVGPRIIASTGAVSVTGGHGDEHGYNHDIMEKVIGIDASICDGPDDCRRAVRAMVKRGADVIKITATGGVLSNTAAGVGQQFTNPELVAIVETATSMGRKVAAHAHEAEGVNAALRAGVQTIEHGSYLNDESVRLFRETGAYLVPTLLAGVSVKEELAINTKIPPAIAAKIRQVAPVVEASFKKALKGNVKIAFGTDSGVSKHGTNAREFEIMVAYGMDENDAIKSATITAAEVIDMRNQLGTISEGKFADIIAVEGNPLENISLLKDMKFVMKNGTIFKK